MSSTIYCERCDTHVNEELRDIHEQTCGGAGYDPYNSADRFMRSQRDTRNEREAYGQLLQTCVTNWARYREENMQLSMLLRRQAG